MSPESEERGRESLHSLKRYKTLTVALVIVAVGLALLVAAAEGLIPAWHHVGRELGIVLLTTALCAFMYEVVVHDTFMSQIRELLDSHTRRMMGPRDGLLGASPHLPEHAKVEVGSARDRVEILQTWMSNSMDYQPAFEKALKQGCAVHVLLLDPNSRHTRDRVSTHYGDLSEDEMRTLGPAKVEANLAELRQLAARTAKGPGRLEVRLYSETPSFCMYRADRVLYLGLYWPRTGAINGLQFKLDTEAASGREVLRHFDLLWEQATKVI